MARLAWLEGLLATHTLKCGQGRPGLSGTSFPAHPTTHQVIQAIISIGAYNSSLQLRAAARLGGWFASTSCVQLEIADCGVSIIAAVSDPQPTHLCRIQTRRGDSRRTMTPLRLERGRSE